MYRLLFLLPVLLILDILGATVSHVRFQGYRSDLRKAGLVCMAMKDVTLSYEAIEILTFGGDGHGYIVGAWKPTPYDYGKYGKGATCADEDVPVEYRGYMKGML